MPRWIVLVTGAGGNIGRRLVPMLVSRGHRVIAASRIRGEAIGSEAIVGDLALPETRQAVVKALSGDHSGSRAVIHLAGLSDANLARRDRGRAFAANVQLTQHMLETTAQAGADKFLLASTGYVYAATNADSIGEDAPVGPRSLYAATKLAAEVMARGYASEGQFSCEILRLSNVYGPDSLENTVVGRILGQLHRGERVAVDSREPVRDFIYVDDTAEAVCRLLEAEAEPGCRTTNVSSGIGTRIGAIADLATWAASGGDVPVESAQEGNDRIVLDNALLRRRLAWTPRYSLLEGLRACLMGTYAARPDDC